MIRSLPIRRWCSRNSAVTTAQIVWLPRSSGLVLQHPSRKKPVTGSVPQGASGPPRTLRAVTALVSLWQRLQGTGDSGRSSICSRRAAFNDSEVGRAQLTWITGLRPDRQPLPTTLGRLSRSPVPHSSAPSQTAENPARSRQPKPLRGRGPGNRTDPAGARNAALDPSDRKRRRAIRPATSNPVRDNGESTHQPLEPDRVTGRQAASTAVAGPVAVVHRWSPPPVMWPRGRSPS